MSIRCIPLGEIRLDGDTQCRDKVSPDTVRDYKESLEAGGKLPPAVVFFDGKDNWLADGFHRWHAHYHAGKKVLECSVRQGTRRDAMLYGIAANLSHGLRYTNSEKRKNVLKLLSDSEWKQWSDSEIGKRCGVHRATVSRLRDELAIENGEKEKPKVTYKKRETPGAMPGGNGEDEPNTPERDRPSSFRSQSPEEQLSYLQSGVVDGERIKLLERIKDLVQTLHRRCSEISMDPADAVRQYRLADDELRQWGGGKR